MNSSVKPEQKGVTSVGIDVSKATVEVAFEGQGKSATYDNTESGLKKLRAQRQKSSETIDVVLMEATGGLEVLAARTLCLRGFSVIVVNPRQAHDFAKAMGYVAQTDATDANALAYFAKTLATSEKREKLLYWLPSAEVARLSGLVIRRDQRIGMRTMENNRAVTAKQNPQKSVKRHLVFLKKEITRIEKEIGDTMDDHFKDKLKLLASRKGLGKVTQAVLIASLPELGTLNEKEISKLVGVAPLNRDSGQMKGRRTTWGGRAGGRKALYMAALSAARCEPTSCDFYLKLREKGKRPKVARVACMHKMLRILNALVKNQTS